MKWLITILSFFVLVSLVNAIEYTPTTETSCNNGLCTKTIYSGTHFVYEDNQWKKIEEARSLKSGGFEIRYVEHDERYEIIVNDFNYTSIDVTLNPKGFLIFPLNLPIETFDKESKSKNKKDLDFSLIKQSHREVIDLALGERLKFGTNSTVVELRDANSENIADTHVREGTATTNYGSDTSIRVLNSSGASMESMFRFNKTIIPAGATIEYAELGLHYITANLDVGESMNLTLLHYYNQTWVETYPTWNNKPTGNELSVNDYGKKYFNKTDPVVTAMVYFNVTDLVANETNNFVSMYLIATDIVGSPTSLDYLVFDTKEDATVGNRPILNITYSNPFDIFECQNLTTANTQYNIANSLVSSNTCIFVKANNVTINGQGYSINFSTANGVGFHSGVNIFSVNDTKINNLTIFSDLEDDNTFCIYADTTTNKVYARNAIVQDIVANHCLNGLDIEGLNHTFRNIRIENSSYSDITFFNATNITIDNVKSYGDNQIQKFFFNYNDNIVIKNYNATGNNLAYLASGGEYANNITIIDSKLNGGIALASDNSFNLINSTYTTETVSATGLLKRYWYLTLNVTNSAGSGLTTSSYNISNISTTLIHSGTTDSNGLVTLLELSYTNNSITTTDIFNATAWKSGYLLNSSSVGLNSNVIQRILLNSEASDSCAYSSGNWNVNCADNCVVNSPVNLGGNQIIFTNSGQFVVNADIVNIGKWDLSNSCKIIINNGKKFG